MEKQNVIVNSEMNKNDKSFYNYCRKHQGIIKGTKLNKAFAKHRGQELFNNGSTYYINGFNAVGLNMFSLSENSNYYSVHTCAEDGSIGSYNKPMDIEETSYGVNYSEQELKDNVFFDAGGYFLRLYKGKEIFVLEPPKNLKELCEHNERAQAYQDTLPANEVIELLKKHKKSVFTFHMKNGDKLIRGDSESNREEMELFFKRYPQTGCDHIEFHK